MIDRSSLLLDYCFGKCMAKWVEKLQTTKMALMRLTTLQSEQQWFIVDYGAENDKKRNSKSKTFLVIFYVAAQTCNCLQISNIHLVIDCNC